MASTYELIASQTLGSSAASVTFSGIPGTYDDLVLVGSVRSDYGSNYSNLGFRFNGDSGSNYSFRYLLGDGTNASSGSSSSQTASNMCIATGSTSTSNTFASFELVIPGYAGSSAKSASSTSVSEENGTTARIATYAALWSGTSAISSVEVRDTLSANIVTGSSFYLYGVTHA